MTPPFNSEWDSANQAYLSVALVGLRGRLGGGSPEASIAEMEGAVAAMPPGTFPALERLCEAFGLTEFERDVVLLCAGIELDAGFRDQVARLPGSSHATGRPTFALALASLSETAHWSALAPGGPLRFWRLVEPGGPQDEPLTTSPLRLDERILHFLVGVAGLDERLVGLVRPVRAPAFEDALPVSHQDISRRITQLWAACPGGAAWPAVSLCGPDASARRAVAAAICARLGMSLHSLDARDLPSSATERETLGRLWEREAALSDSALLIEAGDDTSDPERRRGIAQWAARVGGAVFLSATEPLPPAIAEGPAPVRFDLPVPPAKEQETLWRATLGASSVARLNGQLNTLAAQFRLDGDTLRVAAATAEVYAQSGDEGAEAPEDGLAQALWEACRAQARPRLDDLAQRISSSDGWDDLVLPAAEEETLRQIAAHARGRTRVYEEWGFIAKSGRGLGISALFAGPSGTGKTMAAEVLANELRLDLYRVDLASVVSKYIGETEKNLRRIFDAAEYGGAILLFDEADALFGKRSEVKDSHDRYANIEVSYLLQRMEAYRGLAILTTNMKGALDTAFLRRLGFVVNFPFPDAPERARIWRGIFPEGVPTEGLQWDRLAQLNVAGGSIRNIALSAAFLAADAGCPVTMEHIRRAAVREYAKLEQSMTHGELQGWPQPGTQGSSPAGGRP